MHDINASVILAKNIVDNSIIDIISTLPRNEVNIIWMYLTIKTNMENDDEICIGFDIVRHDEENDFGIELGNFIITKTDDEEKRRNIMQKEEIKNGREVVLDEIRKRRGKSYLPFKDRFIIGQKFPPLPRLETGDYEFIVYEKLKKNDEEENHILDTFQFKVE